MLSPEAIARVCHEANRAYCESIGDDTQKAWDHADQWQRDSAAVGVTFTLEHPDATPADQHEAWREAKVKDGWQYGTVKDAAAKTHPCLVDYDRLPESQRRKDSLFLAVVKSLSCPSPARATATPA
jgi:hypothetical protein